MDLLVDRGGLVGRRQRVPRIIAAADRSAVRVLERVPYPPVVAVEVFELHGAVDGVTSGERFGQFASAPYYLIIPDEGVQVRAAVGLVLAVAELMPIEIDAADDNGGARVVESVVQLVGEDLEGIGDRHGCALLALRARAQHHRIAARQWSGWR